MSEIEETIQVQVNGKDKVEIDPTFVESADPIDRAAVLKLLRANISNAKVGTLEVDLNISLDQYQWALSIFYFGYIIFELPSNIILRRWRASYWFAILTCSWGICATCMGAVENFSGLALTRFLLGLTEAAFNGLLGYGLLQINDSSLESWKWMFIIEGLPSILISPFVAWYLPDTPATAKFLTSDEKQLAVRRIAEDAGPAHDESWSWMQVVSVFMDWKTYVFIVIYILGTVPLQGIVLFLPSIISNMGTWSDPVVQLLTIPPYIMAFLGIRFMAHCSGNYFDSSTHMIGINIILMVGFLILMFAPVSNVAANYVGACIVTIAVYANAAVKAPWFNSNYGGLTRRAVASAVIVSVGTIGGAIGGQIYYDPPTYFAGNTIAFSCVGAQTIVVIIARTLLSRENKRRELLNQEQKDYELLKYGSVQIAGDRHPDFRYDL
ncbi:major facilitator superfamily domain-containing protein [Phycomyces blakesleeanus]|uniref:Major facilitator superfamily domain-containing protein n=1 Tax=Phycomyces blakesleeanus TaxID=4837 RepID=A0ABR3B4C1_PHYBL